MAKAISKPVITFSVVIEINEEEARALYAMSFGDVSKVAEVAYTGLPPDEKQSYREGLRGFLQAIQQTVSPMVKSIEKARAAAKGGA